MNWSKYSGWLLPAILQITCLVKLYSGETLNNRVVAGLVVAGLMQSILIFYNSIKNNSNEENKLYCRR